MSDVATQLTGEVEMLTSVNDLPSGLCLSVGVGLESGAHVREEIQRSVNRGPVDVGVPSAGLLGDLPCGQMPSP